MEGGDLPLSLNASSSISPGRYETPEDVFQDILKWIQDANIDAKLAENAVSHISSKMERALKPLETTCVESQYVKALLTSWARACLTKAFSYLEDKTTDISKEMSNILAELDSINSVEDIGTKLNEETSQLWTLFNEGRPYIQLILKQEDLFKNTPRFAILLDGHFKDVKRFFINKVFSRCKDDIINDGLNDSSPKEFISALTDFLINANEDKRLQVVVKNFMFKSSKPEIPREMDGKERNGMEEWANKLVEIVRSALPPESDTKESVMPEWVKRFESASSKIEMWTQKLKLLFREMCKKIFLPITDIKVKRQYGRKIIFISGVAIFVSQQLKQMKLKAKYHHVEEIQIVGQSSVHIDCDLENEIWHGINVGIVTDKLVVCADENDKNRVWDVSGRNGHIVKSRRDWQEAGESGGHVHIKCNEIIGAERWTIASNGEDGGSARKWSLEEFKKVFSPILPLDTDTKKDPYETLYQNLKIELGVFLPVEDVLLQHKFKAKFTRSMDGSEIKYSLHEDGKKKRHTLILCKGAPFGRGGYGGDIILELSNKESGVPPIGMEMYQAMNTGGVVYKATGSDGKWGQPSGDVGYIHNGDENQPGNYIGFENNQTLEILVYSKKNELKKAGQTSYAKVNLDEGAEGYATIVAPDVQPNDSSLSEEKPEKKNAVIRRILVDNFSKIKERKQILESLRMALKSDLLEENQSQNVDHLMEEIRNNEILIDDQVGQHFNQEKVVHTKPAPVVRSSADCDAKGEGPIDLPKVVKNDKLVRFNEYVEILFKSIQDKRTLGKKVNIKKKWNKTIILDFKDSQSSEISIERLAEYFYDFECAVQQLRKPQDENFQLRNYQIEAVLAGLRLITKSDFQKNAVVPRFIPFSSIPERNNTLTEISTGNGKSLIVAASAIANAFASKPSCIDVITSNNLLAIRDSNLSVAEGGLKDLYEYFGVSVANNCSSSEDERRESYTAKVVYGQLANFQRDYLLDVFYGRNIRGNRRFLHVIIDEVDCMLLDQGNNILYLSHDIPGMETLESLYVFIWDEICNSPINKAIPDYREQAKELIKSRVLYDLYGVITEDDLKLVHAPLNDLGKVELWNHLIKKKVIDRNGRLLIDDANQMTEEKINYTPKNAEKETNLNAKLVFYLRQVANRQRQIRIPAHLLDFVDRHLDTWLESAFQALDLRPDEDYVIDQDRTDTSPDLNPRVIIIDPDTGTDQTLSQWDEALHQFVQLKEGCKLTLQSLKAVFISNAIYIKKYDIILGMSGTLGSEVEQRFLCDTFKCCLHFPSLPPKDFKEKPAQVLSTEEEWLHAIVKETETIMKEGRSIVIFCEFIKDVTIVHQRLKSSFPELGSNRLHRYTRDYVKFTFEGTELDIGHVIVATNLAGRGTDIKISQKLRENGGLHVCLSYFPENQRIEEQAMGRAARNKAPGSGILIVCKKEKKPIEIMKSERTFQEKQRIARMVKDFKRMEFQGLWVEELSKRYHDFKDELREKNYDDQIVSAMCGNVLDRWTLDLDEFNQSEMSLEILLLAVVALIEIFLREIFKEKTVLFPVLKPDAKQDNLLNEALNRMAPARLVVVAKHLATRNKKPDLPQAADILEKLLQSNDRHFYPAAFYYRAFTLLKENYETNKNEFIKTLRTCENVLNEHINMQISLFSAIQTMGKKTEQPHSFCVVDGYTQQKENVINLFQYFLISVRSLLGTNCSIEDFEAAGKLPKEVQGVLERNVKNLLNWIEHESENFKVFQGKEKQKKDPNKPKKGLLSTTVDKIKRIIRTNLDDQSDTIPPEMVEKYFKLLLEGESKCIGHQLNDASTIPSWNSSFEQHAKTNQQLAIERIANAYGFCASTLEESLNQVKSLKTALSKEAIEEAIEQEMKKKFEEDNIIPCTRESFWAKLVETGALYNNRNFVAVDECNVDTFNLEREEAETFPFDDKDYVIYNPIDVNGKNGQEKKLFFTQKYVEKTLYGNRKKEQLQFNKIAKVDVVKLKSVDLKLFGQLTNDDLREADISKTECQGIMTELKKQDIMDDDGNLSSNYHGQKFEYPNCPAYEDTVMRLVGSKLRAEIVRRQWLNNENNSNRLEAINLLPLTPYRDMLNDLIDAYVISGGVRVNGMDEDVLKTKVNEITEKEHERECILDFLKGRRAVYEATWLTSKEAALDFIDGDIRNVKANTFESELGLFRLMGFDHVIYIKDRKMSAIQIALFFLFAPLVFAGGVVLNVVRALFSKDKPIRAVILLLVSVVSDIIYILTAVISKNPKLFSGFLRNKFRLLSGKHNLGDQIKTLWNLCTRGADKTFRPAVRLMQMDSFHPRRVREKNHEADQREVVNALLQLKKPLTNPSDEDDGELV